MCQADTTLLTMKWSDQSITPIGNLTAPHECVNWDRLMEWVKPNSRDLSAEGWLIHPKFGMSILFCDTHSVSSNLTNICWLFFQVLSRSMEKFVKFPSVHDPTAA